jgi:hypothetical protein
MEIRDPGRVFGEIAESYGRVRPPYPAARSPSGEDRIN